MVKKNLLVDTKYQPINCKGDPDGCDPVLHKHHLLLWSKPLPNGLMFNLVSNKKEPYLLIHESELGEFYLSSDSIGHTYTYRENKQIQEIMAELPESEKQSFYGLCSTIGGYIVFPSKKINNKPTINGLRGLDKKIDDRFDLTLECIRRWYIGEESPLSECLDRYESFFRLFGDFKGYTEFFLLQDLVDEGTGKIRFWLPFEEFGVTAPLPQNTSEYLEYRKNLSEFIIARNLRIDAVDIYVQE